MRCLGFPSSRQSTRRAAAPAVRAAAALVPVTEVRLAVFGDGGDTYAGGGELRFDLAGAGIAPAGMNIKAAVFGIVGADGDRQKRGGGVCDRSVRIGSQKKPVWGEMKPVIGSQS